MLSINTNIKPIYSTATMVTANFNTNRSRKSINSAKTLFQIGARRNSRETVTRKTMAENVKVLHFKFHQANNHHKM